MNSTFFSQNADNMSRKSEFSNWFSFERPGVEGELPHHLQALGRGSFGEVLNVRSVLSVEIGYSDF